jgi:hypothetical protein
MQLLRLALPRKLPLEKAPACSMGCPGPTAFQHASRKGFKSAGQKQGQWLQGQTLSKSKNHCYLESLLAVSSDEVSTSKPIVGSFMYLTVKQ